MRALLNLLNNAVGCAVGREVFDFDWRNSDGYCDTVV